MIERRMSVNHFLGLFIFLGCCLMVFQNIAIPAASSRYDLTCFLLLFATLFFQKNRKELSLSIVLLFLFFICLELLKSIYFPYSPLGRTFSGIIWFGGLLIIFLKKDYIFYDQNSIYKAFIFGFFATVLGMTYQLIFGMETALSSSFFRPVGFFDEPSYAGLFMFSIAAGFFALCVLKKNKKKELLFYVILGSIAIIYASLTFTMHVFTFFLMLGLMILISLSISKNAIYKISFLSLSALVFFISLNFLLNQEHFIERLSFIGSMNLSVVAWIQGFDQALFSFKQSPIIGLGLGSTGGFDFISDTHYKLELMNKIGQNKLDAYSMTYRLIVEVGFIFYLFITLAIAKEIVLFRETIKEFANIPALKFYIFNFIFSLSLMLGILIKEPTYARSYVYVSVLIFFTARLIFTKTKNSNKTLFSS